MTTQADLLLHPIRLRIIQCAAQYEPCTVTQLSAALPDIPKATLYRHVKVLFDAGVLTLVSETRKRGTLERSYRLDFTALTPADAGGEAATLIYSVLTKLFGDFARFTGQPDSDPVAARLFAATNSLQLNDANFEQFIGEYFALVRRYLDSPDPDGAPRVLTLVSSPTH